ncbi:uncharacterized protein si:ch211-149b19.4 [Ctenopharyngodon idella]|uniref:uncharacterized protein si:ch211-149b19.4 n=1 Tax=Ctenopharyngodon idella TaxID=7959 RepID=UPI002232A14B|nr:uncharacterized protein si:ch211-149b19.4 [Ctenopharyngodon idella]
MMFYRSEQTPKILLIMCVWGIFPLTTDQFPVLGSFNLLLYPVSVTGPYGPQTLLIPVTTTERNTQHNQTSQANSSKISSQSLSKPLNANSAFLQPEPVRGPAPSPAPDLHMFPSETSVLQGQMSNFIPSNVPLQVYSFVQQAVISDSGSSEEGDAAQVVYMVPVHVESPNMGVMEGSAPVPDPGHLHVPVTTSALETAAPPDAQGQLGKTLATETATRTDILGKKGL